MVAIRLQHLKRSPPSSITDPLGELLAGTGCSLDDYDASSTSVPLAPEQASLVVLSFDSLSTEDHCLQRVFDAWQLLGQLGGMMTIAALFCLLMYFAQLRVCRRHHPGSSDYVLQADR